MHIGESKARPATTGLAGWVQLSEACRDVEISLGQLTSGLNSSLEPHHLTTPDYGCASTAALFHNSDTVTALIIGRPNWKSKETQLLSTSEGHSAALARCYEQYGESFIEHVFGEFAFAILDSAQKEVILGTDRMGRYPIYYSLSDNTLFFGSSAGSVLTLRATGDSIQPQGIYNYIYFHMIPSPTSAFEGLQKIPFGSMLKHKNGNTDVRRYWNPVFKESSNNSQVELYAELKNQLRSAVKASLPEHGKVGAFLSGGLDSSTVTGMLAELSEQPCDVYSIGFSAKGYDEMEYARITANHFGAKLHEYYVTPDDVVSALPHIATSYDEPFGNSSALPAYFCARMAKQDGVSLLLAGDGGDEIFAGNERYAQQRIFEAYQEVPTWLRRGFLEPLVKHMPDWVPLADKSRSYISQANTPLPGRLQTYNFLHRYEAGDIFQRDFLEGIDIAYPQQLQREVFHTPQSASQLNRMLFLDWQFTLADNDLRKVSHMCAVAGIDVAYPMIDDTLVEFSQSIPSNMKMPGSKLRNFYKLGLTGWLPDATISKKKQGFGLPFGVWMAEHKPLQELAYDNILKLKSRNIFSPQFLDNAIELHRDGHAAYFGELIWILTVLELWMSKDPLK